MYSCRMQTSDFPLGLMTNSVKRGAVSAKAGDPGDPQSTGSAHTAPQSTHPECQADMISEPGAPFFVGASCTDKVISF